MSHNVPGTTAGTYTSGSDSRVTGALQATALDTSVGYPPSFRLPRYPQAAAVLTEWQSGHGFTASGGTLSTDSTTYIRGTQCVRYVSPGDNATYNITGTISAADTTSRMLRILVRVDDITTLQNLDVQVAVDNTFASGWTWNPQGTTGTSTYITSGDWVLMSLGFADATALGAGARSGLTALRVRVRDTGAPVTVRLQAAELIADGTAVFPNGAVVITADDAYQSFVDLGAAKLDGYGFPVTMYLIADRIGLSGRLTMQEILDRQATAGWEAACHAWADSAHGTTYTGLTAAAADTDARAMKAFAVTNGFRGADLFALPKGATAKTTDGQPLIPILARYYASVASTVNKTRETWPPGDPFRVRRISAISSFSGGYSPANITGSGGDLDKVKANGGVLVLNFHQIVASGPTDTSMILQSDFAAIMDAIASKGLRVLTMGELMRYGLTSAAVDSTTIPSRAGAGAAGSAVLASPATHVHPRYGHGPEDHGLTAWTFDPLACTGTGTVPTSGVLQLARIYIPVATTISTVHLFVDTPGSGLTSGQCFAAVYNAAGTLLSATADQSTAWASSGLKSMALTAAQVVGAGYIDVAFFSNGTTNPAFAKANKSNAMVNANLSSSTSLWATGATGLTTAMPGTAGTRASSSNAYWAAVS